MSGRNYLDSRSTINILNTLSQCSYPSNFRDFISSVILELSNAKGSQFYKVNKARGNVTDTIIVIKYIIPTSFSNKTYEIPILIYIGKSFPYEAPEIYLERTPETGANPKNINIDSNTFRIVTSSMKTWNQFSIISTVISEIKSSFNLNFPIYKLSKRQEISRDDYSQIGNNNQIDFNSFQGQGQYNQGNQNLGYNSGIQSGLGNTQGNIQSTYNQGSIYNQGQGSIYNQGNQNQGSQGNQGLYTQNNFTQQNVQDQVKPQTIYDNIKPEVNRGSIYNNINNIKINETPEEGIKRVLVEEIMNSVDAKVKEELKKFKQQEENLNNFKSDFLSQIERYQKVMGDSGNIQNEFQNIIKKCELEINSVKNYIMENSSKVINSENFESYIEIGNQNLLRIVAIEATIEDFISVIKRAFEKQVISFEESVKFIRTISREACKVKYYREKIIQNCI